MKERLQDFYQGKRILVTGHTGFKGSWLSLWLHGMGAEVVENVGAYFDHESETPGLGAKIKDEAWFREQFKGKTVDFAHPDNPFGIIKGGAPKEDRSKIDAITGATMTCNGLDAALDTWFKAYMPFLEKKAAAAVEDDDCCCEEGCEDGCCEDGEGHQHEHHHHHNHQEG